MISIRRKNLLAAAQRKEQRRERIPVPLAVLMGYVTSLALEGPLRSLLSVIRMENLLYVRDLLAVLVIAHACHFPSFESGRPARRGFIGLIVYIAFCHAILGLWLGNQVPPVLFALKIFVAFVFGMAVAEHVHGKENLFARFMWALFIVSSIGVYINAVVGAFPWEGMDYDTAFGSVKNTRVWWAGGERRLSGFTRANYSAASAIGLSGVFLAAYVKNRAFKILIFLVGMPAIYLTTSKGVIISFFIITLWSLLKADGGRNKAGSMLAYAFALIAVAAPIVSSMIGPSPDLVRTAPSILSSFADRASVTWPNAFELVTHWWQWVVGFGLGAVASPLKFGPNMWAFNPIDNMPLYFYFNFGVLGLLYFGFLVARVAVVVAKDRFMDFNFGLMAVGLLVISYGITTQIMEDPLVTIVFGVAVAYASFAAGPSGFNGRVKHE